MASRTADQRPYIVLGVSGGIAAYKACELLRRFTESGHAVRVIPTDAALRFVGAATWESLSGERVTTSVYDDVAEVAHVRIGKRADLVVVAPATADLIARAAAGRADDLLTATLLTATCPVLMAPAMHTEMWQHAATQANVATLRRRGVLVLEPAVGRLTGSDTGPGRLPDPGEIFDIAVDVLRRGRAELLADLAGRRVVVSAGGTREPLDPVRFLGNRSSGRQGYALAKAAVARGADVTLVAANTELPDPAGVKVVRVGSTLELADAVMAAAVGADAVVMAAAPADFRPKRAAGEKIHREASGGIELDLEATEDILASLTARRRQDQTIVGFAAETGEGVERAREKLDRKGADAIVLNDVSRSEIGFESPENEVVIVERGGEHQVPLAPKEAVADAILDRVDALRSGSGTPNKRRE
jgi:phosphopantothenoylcysteine decarboxylase / phosphopantothenate---cysteine ligase